MRTEAWWVCYRCDTPIKKVGKARGVSWVSWDDHRKLCPNGGGGIQQIPQGSKPGKKAR